MASIYKAELFSKMTVSAFIGLRDVYAFNEVGRRLHIFKRKFVTFVFLPPAQNGVFNPRPSSALLQVVFVDSCSTSSGSRLIFFTCLVCY